VRPAFSVVIFTVAAGAGYGLLAMLGLLAGSGVLPSGRWFAALALTLALGAVSFGLRSATVDPDRAEAAIGDLSQWRTSWPSRIGVLAAATCAPALPFAVGWVFYGQTEGIFRLFGLATALFSGLTVYAIGMACATLAPIDAWCNRWVVPNHLAQALLTATLWLNALVILFGRPSPDVSMVTVLALFVAFYLKRKYWRFIDLADDRTISAAGAAGSRIAREDAVRLRRYAFVFLFALPLILSLVGMERTAWVAGATGLLAAVSASIGLMIERWLFFAEARPPPRLT